MPSAMTWSTETVSTLRDLRTWTDNLAAINAGDVLTGRSFCFRGEPKDEKSRLPGLARQGRSGLPATTLLQLERDSLREFWAKGRHALSSTLNTFGETLLEAGEFIELMPYAQHYGLPTRLMDWTTEFHVALWAACSTHIDQPGFVYCFHRGTFQDYLGAQWDTLGVGLAPRKSVQRDWTAHLLVEDPPAFVTAWLYPHTLQRMKAQGSLYTVGTRVTEAHDDFLLRATESADCHRSSFRLRVPFELKESVVRWLAGQGHHHDALYFKTLDDVASQIARKMPASGPA